MVWPSELLPSIVGERANAALSRSMRSDDHLTDIKAPAGSEVMCSD